MNTHCYLQSVVFKTSRCSMYNVYHLQYAFAHFFLVGLSNSQFTNNKKKQRKRLKKACSFWYVVVQLPLYYCCMSASKNSAQIAAAWQTYTQIHAPQSRKRDRNEQNKKNTRRKQPKFVQFVNRNKSKWSMRLDCVHLVWWWSQFVHVCIEYRCAYSVTPPKIDSFENWIKNK